MKNQNCHLQSNKNITFTNLTNESLENLVIKLSRRSNYTEFITEITELLTNQPTHHMVVSSINEYRYFPPFEDNLPFITDILVIPTGEPIPKDYHRLKLSQYDTTVKFSNVDFCIKKGNQNPITGLALIFPNEKEIPPIGFVVIKNPITGQAVDLYQGTKMNEMLFLCVRREVGCPIRDIDIIPFENELPSNYFGILDSPTGCSTVLSSKTKTKKFVLCFNIDFSQISHLKFQDHDDADNKPYTDSYKLRYDAKSNLKKSDTFLIDPFSPQNPPLTQNPLPTPFFVGGGFPFDEPTTKIPQLEKIETIEETNEDSTSETESYDNLSDSSEVQNLKREIPYIESDQTTAPPNLPQNQNLEKLDIIEENNEDSNSPHSLTDIVIDVTNDLKEEKSSPQSETIVIQDEQPESVVSSELTEISIPKQSNHVSKHHHSNHFSKRKTVLKERENTAPDLKLIKHHHKHRHHISLPNTVIRDSSSSGVDGINQSPENLTPTPDTTLPSLLSPTDSTDDVIHFSRKVRRFSASSSQSFSNSYGTLISRHASGIRQVHNPLPQTTSMDDSHLVLYTLPF